MRGVCLLSVIMPVRPIAGNTLPISPNPTRRRYDGGRGRIVRIVKKPIIRQYDLEFIQPQVPIQSDLSLTPPHPTPSRTKAQGAAMSTPTFDPSIIGKPPARPRSHKRTPTGM